MSKFDSIFSQLSICDEDEGFSIALDLVEIPPKSQSEEKEILELYLGPNNPVDPFKRFPQ